MSFLTNEDWVSLQFSECVLDDVRRTKRLVKVGGAMLDSPDTSIPQQNVQWSDTKAAYRLFSSPSVTFQGVAEVHWKRTRLNAIKRCLLISDTTDIDHTCHNATAGLGMLGNGNGRGVQLHSCLVYSTDEDQILGVAGAQLHYRKRTAENETRTQRLKRKRESQLWGDLVNEIGPAPKNTQETQWIHVFDRGQLRDAIEQANYLGSYELELRSRPGVAARTMAIDVSSIGLTLPVPKRKSPWLKTCGISSIQMSVVLVRETNAPAGKKPVQWVLYTSLPVRTFDQAWQVIEDYEQRWLIEEYHKVLKSGCNIQGHALRTADRLEALIGLISVIGTRLLQLKLIGRSQPDVKAKNYVPAQWLNCLQKYRPKLQTKTMTVYHFFRELAKLGGFLARKNDGEPGWQTTWRGYKKLTTIMEGLRLATKNQK